MNKKNKTRIFTHLKSQVLGCLITIYSIQYTLAFGNSEFAMELMLLNNRNARQYSDIWARIRAGFKLKHLENSRVQYFEEFYSKHPKSFANLIARSKPYLYYILNEIEKNGMPSELVFIPAIESSFNPKIRQIAAGMWQFESATGKRFNMQQNNIIDERCSIVKSTRSALKYFNYLYLLFGQWDIAIGAYNWGEGNMYRAVAKATRKNGQIEYDDLPLREITANYVPKLIALANIIENPKKFGIVLNEIENKPAFAIVQIPESISASMFSQLALMSSTEELIELNPQFLLKETHTLSQGDKVLLPIANQTIYYAMLDENNLKTLVETKPSVNKAESSLTESSSTKLQLASLTHNSDNDTAEIDNLIDTLNLDE